MEKQSALQQSVSENRFKDEILQEVGEIPVSSTQKIRVLKVWDVNENKAMLSVQKWWRPNKNADWVAGKGFKLDKDQSSTLSILLGEGVREF